MEWGTIGLNFSLAELAEGEKVREQLHNPQERSLHTNPVTCYADHDIEDCLKQVRLHPVRRIPVIDEDGCVGIERRPLRRSR
ncbi:CBS domain-containing protein [Nitrospira sp. Nam74]